MGKDIQIFRFIVKLNDVKNKNTDIRLLIIVLEV